MTCDDARILMHGHLDGELELGRALELERHLAECPRCAPEYATLTALRTRVRDGAMRYPAPAGLEERIRTALDDNAQQHDAASASSRRPASVSRAPRVPRWKFGVAASAGLAAAVLAAVVLMRTVQPDNEDLVNQVVASHVRSLMASHLLDVVSTDQHTVKPWFDGKLDFSPPVTDFAKQGFPLIGGRLDYINRRSVAALVYKRGKHVINVFMWPHEGGSQPPVTPAPEQGYNVEELTVGAMNCLIVSDLNDAELKKFADLIRERG